MTTQSTVQTAPAVAKTFATLAECEVVIANYITSYEEAGQALLDIHERQLWQEAGYVTFEAYVADRWQLSTGRASQLMSAGKFLRHLDLARANLPAPATERHFRPLMRVRGARDEPELQAWERRTECWRIVHDTARNNSVPAITVEFISGIVDRYYRGGTRVNPPPPPLVREDLEVAFAAIAQCGLTPHEALIKFGDTTGWEHFEDAFQWMAQARDP